MPHKKTAGWDLERGGTATRQAPNRANLPRIFALPPRDVGPRESRMHLSCLSLAAEWSLERPQSSGQALSRANRTGSALAGWLPVCLQRQ